MKVAVIHQGRFGNKVFQYLVARQLAATLGADQVAGCHIPELGIRSPAPAGLGRALMCTGNRLALDDVLRAVSRGRFNSVIVSGNVLQYRCLPPLDAARRWLGLEKLPQGGPTAPGDHVVVHVRSGDIVFGAHRDYPPIPPTFYDRVIEEAKLPPIFVTEPGDNYYIDHLRRRWPEARFVSNPDPIDDFRFLMSAQNLAVASSTFGWLAGWLGRAEVVHLPLIGITNPAQRPDVDLVPTEDRRYRYWLFPKFRFHARPSEISTLLSGTLAPTRIHDVSQIRGRALRDSRSQLRRISDGDRWIRRRESLVREPTLEFGAAGRFLRDISQRLQGRSGWLALCAIHAAGFLLWARLALPEHLAASAVFGVGVTFVFSVTHLGFPRLTQVRRSVSQAEASAMHWTIVATSAAIGLIGLGIGVAASAWGTPDWPLGLAYMASAAVLLGGLCAEPSATISRIDGGAIRSASQVIGACLAWAVAVWLASQDIMSASIACVAVGPAIAGGAICATFGGWTPSPPARGAGVRPLLEEGFPDWVAETAIVAVWAGTAAGVWLMHGPKGMAGYAVALWALAAESRPKIRSHSTGAWVVSLPSIIDLALGAVVVVTAPTAIEALLPRAWEGVGAGLQVIVPWYVVACVVSRGLRSEAAVDRHSHRSVRNPSSSLPVTAAGGIAITCASLMGMAVMLHVAGAVMVMLVTWQGSGPSIHDAWLCAKRTATSLVTPVAAASAGGLVGSWTLRTLDAMPVLLKVPAAVATTLVLAVTCARLLGGARRSAG